MLSLLVGVCDLFMCFNVTERDKHILVLLVWASAAVHTQTGLGGVGIQTAPKIKRVLLNLLDVLCHPCL